MESGSALSAASARRLSAWFALWLILGYVFALYAGAIVADIVWDMAVGIRAGMHGGHIPPHLQPGNLALAWSVVTGMLLGAGWVTAFSWYYAKPWLREAGATGVAWQRPTGRDAYFFAIVLAVGLAALVGLVEHLIPPDPEQLTGPLQRLANSHGMAYVLFVIAAVGLAPAVEEFIFRGAAFAALAHRFGTAAAAVVTTLAFVVLHAADKIHYWPGFILVGCLAVTAIVLRLHYRSLWPGILLHATYNGLLILLS
ncbi:MAG TPA: CPBP family intramembrane glutamic endopeptidase [Gammaproteobacteria bacterium]|nr:CPBP family intramembrane glutamic endopeptidase [Gammaproteobacteria bacterium]